MVSNWIVSLFALLLCAVFFFETYNVKTMPGADPAGPTFYPLIVITVTVAAALAVLAQSALAMGLRRARESDGMATAPAWSFGKEGAREAFTVGLVMLLSLIYPLAILKIGFVLATAGFTIILMQLFEQRLRVSVPLSVTMAVMLHFFFSDLLKARIVPGQWFDLMRWLGL